MFVSAGSSYTLIEEEPKNWCEAQHYCRKHFTDLVSISNDSQNHRVISEGKGGTFWIGLLHDDWQWADKSCSTFRQWDNNDILGNCTMQDRYPRMFLYKQDCTAISKLLCSKGKQ